MNTSSKCHVLLLVFLITPTLIFSATPLQDFPIAKPGCRDQCGDVRIPFPFGTTPTCYASTSYAVTCDDTSNPPTLYLGRGAITDGSVPVINISLSGQLRIRKRIAKRCYTRNGILADEVDPTYFLPFLLTVNNTANKLIVIGCNSFGYMSGLRWWDNYYRTGCIATCFRKDDLKYGSCGGSGCCEMSTLPPQVYKLDLDVGIFAKNLSVTEFGNCTYGFIVEDKEFQFHPDNLTNLNNVGRLPMVLNWDLSNLTCDSGRNSSTYACVSPNSECHHPRGGLGYRCRCMEGYQGNPYLINGCQDIDECQSPELNTCTYRKMCKNSIGSFNCSCPDRYFGNGTGEGGCYCPEGYTDSDKGCRCQSGYRNKHGHEVRVEGCTRESRSYIGEGIALGIIVVMLTICLLYLELKRRRSNKMKDEFFKQNGGTLLREKLKAAGGREMATNDDHLTKIFSSTKLHHATNNFNKSMIIGHGGFGTVYKGFLENKNLVAIKKSKEVDPAQIEQFINEFMVLSRISHRNVVKLLGCCLETEVPLLVYEYINNGTLYDHLHKQDAKGLLVWKLRLKIAIETAGVLAYLHSAASTPIIHRDVKSANILLDSEFNAKVSDFGASRLVPMDQTQIPTMVLGTLGYLDPEYMQTHQLTDKSDVYSFGVVLVELITGKKVITNGRLEEEKSLSSFFLRKLKQGRLCDVLDETIEFNEYEEQQVTGVANLAKVCLNVKGEDRPSMKEVAMELESLKSGGRRSWARHDENADEIKSFSGKGYDNKSYSGKGFDGFVDVDCYSTSMSYDSLKDHTGLSGGR